MKAGLEKRIETLEEKATPPETEMDLIARLVKYERIFRDCDIDSSDDPEIAKLDEEYKALMTPEIEEKMKMYEEVLRKNEPSETVSPLTSDQTDKELDSPQNVDEKLAVVPKDEGSKGELISE